MYYREWSGGTIERFRIVYLQLGPKRKQRPQYELKNPKLLVCTNISPLRGSYINCIPLPLSPILSREGLPTSTTPLYVVQP